MLTITLRSLTHRNVAQIAIGFDYDEATKMVVKQLDGVQWSQTHRTFYVRRDSDTVNRLFAYFKSKGYYVDYSSLKMTNAPIVSMSAAKSRKAMGMDGKALYAAMPKDHKDLLKRYAAYLRGKRLSEQTVSSYGHFVLRFLYYMKDSSIDVLKTEDIDGFMSEVMAKEHYSISSHRQCVSAFKYLTVLCKLHGFDASNYKRPKKSRYLPVVLSMGEVLKIIQVTKNLKHRMVITLLYSGGLRIGELIGLKPGDVDIQRNQIFVRQGKGRKDRMVTFAESLKPLLMNYLGTYKPKMWLIEGRDGVAYSDSSVRKFLEASRKAAGLTKKVSPHTLRHSYATHMLENGVDLRYIQELLGHSKPETTMIYTHVAQKNLAKIRNPLDVAVEHYQKPLTGTKKLRYPDGETNK